MINMLIERKTTSQTRVPKVKRIRVEQGTQEWLDARLGVVTASEFSSLITTKGAKASTYQSYLDKKVAEAVTRQPASTFVTEAMERGRIMEDEAARYYEAFFDCELSPGEFYSNGMWGCSPDRLLGKDRLVEFKCPLAHTQVSYYRLDDAPPSKYWAQIQGQLWVCNKSICEFFSYHPDMPFVHIIVERDEEFIQQLDEIVCRACDKIKKEVEFIHSMERDT